MRSERVKGAATVPLGRLDKEGRLYLGWTRGATRKSNPLNKVSCRQPMCGLVCARCLQGSSWERRETT